MLNSTVKLLSYLLRKTASNHILTVTQTIVFVCTAAHLYTQTGTDVINDLTSWCEETQLYSNRVSGQFSLLDLYGGQ